MAKKITLVYPYFKPNLDKSIFRFPPLGLGYLASVLNEKKFSVQLIDCTFLNRKSAIEKIRQTNPEIIGIYCMFSMKKDALWIAKSIKQNCELLVAGGPLPTFKPEEFLEIFDVVVLGEGEKTILEIVEFENKNELKKIKGIAFKNQNKIKINPKQEPIENLDKIPFPDREFFDNKAYKHYYKKFGYKITSLISSRGCPFKCDFCSQPIFNNQVRFRSPENIVSEIKQIQEKGYNRIWFADDCFTFNPKRVEKICDLLINQKIRINWECLSRVDTINQELAKKMKEAGCVRLFFGIESGNNQILKIMNKQITTRKATRSVITAKKAGIKVGAFFILGYPGETNETILDTTRFAYSLPLDYCSFTFPYPIPGTGLYEKLKNKIISKDPQTSNIIILTEHKLVYQSNFSEIKLKFILIKATVQFLLKKYLGIKKYRMLKPFELMTDKIFKILK